MQEDQVALTRSVLERLLILLRRRRAVHRAIAVAVGDGRRVPAAVVRGRRRIVATVVLRNRRRMAIVPDASRSAWTHFP